MQKIEMKGGKFMDNSQKILDEIISINKEIKGINTRLDGIDSRLDGMDTRLDGMDTRFDALEKKVDNMNTSVIIMETELTRKVDTLLEAHGVTVDHFSKLDSEVNTLNNIVDVHSIQIKLIQDKVKSHK